MCQLKNAKSSHQNSYASDTGVYYASRQLIPEHHNKIFWCGDKESNIKGFVIIYAVIILGAITLSMIVYFSWLAIFSLKSESSHRKSDQAVYLADTCAEIALQHIWSDVNYSGSGNFSGYGGDCTYAVSNSGGENRQINATGIIDNITRKVKISIDKVNSNINIASWREVADF